LPLCAAPGCANPRSMATTALQGGPPDSGTELRVGQYDIEVDRLVSYDESVLPTYYSRYRNCVCDVHHFFLRVPGSEPARPSSGRSKRSLPWPPRIWHPPTPNRSGHPCSYPSRDPSADTYQRRPTFTLRSEYPPATSPPGLPPLAQLAIHHSRLVRLLRPVKQCHRRRSTLCPSSRFRGCSLARRVARRGMHGEVRGMIRTRKGRWSCHDPPMPKQSKREWGLSCISLCRGMQRADDIQQIRDRRCRIGSPAERQDEEAPKGGRQGEHASHVWLLR
jgi:hypothetical protein